MANFKRGRAKQVRAGCAMCKFWKQNGVKGKLEALTVQDRRSMDRMDSSEEDLSEDWDGSPQR